MKYEVPVTYTVTGVITIEADSPDQIIDVIYNSEPPFPVPDNFDLEININEMEDYTSTSDC